MKLHLPALGRALLLFASVSLPAYAQSTPATVTGKTVEYDVNGTHLKGYLALPKNVKGKLPGVVVVHEWWGHNEYARHRADMLAELGYAAFALDMYGKGKQAEEPKGAEHLMTEALSSGQIKARFDEENNITWARALERAGVHVVYGVPNLKTHGKMALVVRREGDLLRRYVHVGTGNYNAGTARIYTDLGLMTSNPDITADVADVFNYLTGYAKHDQYRALLVAPVNLRTGLSAMIEREITHANAGVPAHIIFKANSLVDQKIIELLYKAAQAGVEIDLIIRGMCALRPNIPGVSERIRVRSIVGRYLEHSRIYWFANNQQPEVYVGSADIMERNLDRRVETLFPIRDTQISTWIHDKLLTAYLRDTARTRVLRYDGSWTRLPNNTAAFDSQQFFRSLITME